MQRHMHGGAEILEVCNFKRTQCLPLLVRAGASPIHDGESDTIFFCCRCDIFNVKLQFFFALQMKLSALIGKIYSNKVQMDVA